MDNLLRTLELVVYTIATACALNVAAREGFKFSLEFDVGGKYAQIASGLRPGWMFGRQIDLSDIQWREFRGSTGALSGAFIAFLGLSHLVRRLAPGWQMHYYICFSALLLGVLHGFCAIYVAGLLTLHYYITQRLNGTRNGVLLIWAWSCSTLLTARLLDGLPFANFSPQLAWMDAHRGMLRWQISYNMLMLRCISFSADYLWAAAATASKAPAVETLAGNKARSEVVLRAEQYSLGSFLAYALYPPLYIAGPTMTFNTFATQLAAQRPVHWRKVGTYALRLAASWLVLEVLTHTLYYNAIARFRLWERVQAQRGTPLPPLQLALVGFWVLVFMWLKFLVMWRFFRLFALADGVEPPENMLRCVCNNYDVEGFWRNWHASFNQWLVRYLYIPLGGRRWRALNVWLIFAFVALWHDLEWRLLNWAWIMPLLFAPELGCKWLAAQPWMASTRQRPLWRHACAAAAAVNIVLLMSANLVGFVVGLDGAAALLSSVLQKPHFALTVFVSLYSAAQLMFALRDWEAARGSTVASRQHKRELAPEHIS